MTDPFLVREFDRLALLARAADFARRAAILQLKIEYDLPLALEDHEEMVHEGEWLRAEIELFGEYT